MAELTGPENLVRRVYSIGESSPVIAALSRQASAARALGATGAGGPSYGLLAFIERVTRILRRISVLQVTPIMDEPLAALLPPEAPQVSVAGMRAPAPPEPLRVRVARGEAPASIDGVIRGIIRRLGFGVRPAEAENAPPPVERAAGVEEIDAGAWRPRPPARRAAYSVPEYRERVVAAVQPLFTFPAEEPGYAEPAMGGPPAEEPGGLPPTEGRPRPPVAAEGLGAPVKPRRAPWRPTPRVARVADMAKRVSGLAVSAYAASQPVIQARLVETVLEARLRATEAVVQVTPWAPGSAALELSPAGVGSAGAPIILETGAGRPRLEHPVAAAPLIKMVGGASVERVQDASRVALEREAGRGAASTASQVSMLSKRMAEDVAQVYRRGVAEKLPPHRRLTGGLALTPTVGEAQAMTLEAAATAAALGAAPAPAADGKRGAPAFIPAMLQLTLIGAQMAAASREAQSIASRGLRDVSGAVPRLVTAAAGLTGFAPAVLPGELGATPGLTFKDALARVAAVSLDAEAAVSESVNQMAVALKVGPIGVQQVERAALEATPPMPGMRIREVLPPLSGEAQRREGAARPTLERPRPTYEKPRPIDIKVEGPEDVDLRELERKIARILRDEARRYGVR